MVCLSSRSPRGAALVRKGSRLAGRLSTDWFVVFVETPRESPEQIDAEAQRYLLANIELARELGAEVIRLRDRVDAVVDAILDFARSHGVGHVVVGRSAPAALVAAVRGARSRCGWCGRRAASTSTSSPPKTRRRRLKLRSKLLLAQAPLAVALAARRRAVRAGHHPARGSVAADPGGQLPQRAGRAADEGVARAHRQRPALRPGGPRPSAAASRSPPARRSKPSCSVQEGNVTEAGEGEVTRALRAALERVRAPRSTATWGCRPPRATGPTSRALAPRFIEGQAARRRASWPSIRTRWCARAIGSRRARICSSSWSRAQSSLAVGAGAARRQLADPAALRPLGVVTAAVRRFGERRSEGARRRAAAGDEIAAVAAEFNRWPTASNATGAAPWASSSRRSRRPRRPSMGWPTRSCC